MARNKRPTIARLEAAERKAQSITGGIQASLVVGLVNMKRETVRTIQLIGREVVDVQEKPQVFVPEWYEDFLYPAFYKGMRGGRASAKTHSAIRGILLRMQAVRTYVGCFREIQKSISESVKQTIELVIGDMGLRDEFYITKTEISHLKTGSKMIFAGLKHNVTSIKGMDWLDIFFCEEAENISEASWSILEPTMRKDGVELHVCYNPKNILDSTHLRCDAYAANPFDKDGKRIAIVKLVNYTENPWFTEASRLQMERMKEDDPDLYEHIWLGMPNADSEHAIIKPSWIEAAVDAHNKILGFEISGEMSLGQDVADSGADTSAMIISHGSYVFHCDEWKGKDVIFTAKRAWNHGRDFGIHRLVYDSIGVGAGVKAKLYELEEMLLEEGRDPSAFDILGFNAGGAVINPTYMYTEGKTNGDMFSNVKAQAWWLLSDRFYKTWRAVHHGDEYDSDELISLDKDLPHLDRLKAELSRPRVDTDNNGRSKVESKKDMAKRGIPSPNLADALIMCFAPIEGGGAGMFAPKGLR